MPPFLAWWMPAKKSVKLPIAAGRCKMQSAALCSSRAAIAWIFARSGPSADSSAESAPAQCEARILAGGHQRVQSCSGRGFCCARCLPGKQPRLQSGLQVEDLVPDRNPAARRAPGRAEHPKREVLDRELGMALSRGDPAGAPRVMRFVDQAHHRYLPSVNPKPTFPWPSAMAGKNPGSEVARTPQREIPARLGGRISGKVAEETPVGRTRETGTRQCARIPRA